MYSYYNKLLPNHFGVYCYSQLYSFFFHQNFLFC